MFFAPLLFAMWLYFGPHSWLTSETKSHGVLIQPPRPLEELASLVLKETYGHMNSF